MAQETKNLLTIALAKGRLQDDALALLARGGVRVRGEDLASRRLALTDDRGRYRFVLVKPSDVPVYVERGSADCGIVGRDVIAESGADVLQPLDLGLGLCRLAVAGKRGASWPEGAMWRVATKYPRLAAEYFGGRGVPVEIIPLAGSVELAPLLGLSDVIVDLVETGSTLRANGLEIMHTISTTTARFIVNRASYQLKTQALSELMKILETALATT